MLGNHRSQMFSLAIAAAASVGLLATDHAQAAFVPLGVPTPILEYTFNDAANGTTSVSTGSDTTAVTFYTSNAQSTTADLHGPASSGINGSLLDLAYKNTAATGSGSGSTGTPGGIATASVPSALDNLGAWTVSGWLKTDSGSMGKNEIWFANGSIKLSPTNSTVLYVTSGNGTQQSLPYPSAISGTTKAWIFYAVTFDGSDFNGYFSVKDTVPALTHTSVSKGAGTNTGTAGGTILLGNNGDKNKDRPFDGYMDNVRVFGSALTSAQLTSLRDHDITTAVPEPGTFAVLAMGGAAMLMRRRRNVSRA